MWIRTIVEEIIKGWWGSLDTEAHRKIMDVKNGAKHFIKLENHEHRDFRRLDNGVDYARVPHQKEYTYGPSGIKKEANPDFPGPQHQPSRKSINHAKSSRPQIIGKGGVAFN